MKKIISLALCFVMLLSLVSALPAVFASDDIVSGTCGTNLTWTVDKSTLVLTISGTGDMNNYTAVQYAPWYKYSPNYVYIESGVTSIGTRAFYNTGGIQILSIPDTLTSIGNEAFYYLPILREIDVDEANTVFAVIDGCLVNLADHELIVGQADASIPADGSVTTIDAYAFYGRRNFTPDLVIPACITSIGKAAFGFCNLNSITVDPANTVYSSTGYALVDDAEELLVAGTKDIIIPSDGSVTKIGDSAFRGYQNANSIVIPEGIVEIGPYAFSACPNALNLVIPSTVKTIGTYAFSEDRGLTEVVIPSGVETIEQAAFTNCSGIETLIIPDSVTTLGNIAFSNCESLKNVSVGSGVTANYVNTFRNCAAIENITLGRVDYTVQTLFDYSKNSIKSVTFADNITDVPSNYCNGLGSLETVNLGSVASIGERAFGSCTALNNVVIPGSVRSIGDYAFTSCTSLNDITLSEGVESIGYYAFGSCTALESINIPSTVTSISPAIFAFDDALQTITVDDANTKYAGINNCIVDIVNGEVAAACKTSVIPDDPSVTAIGDYVFFGLNGVTEIEIPDNITSIGNSAFAYCGSLEAVEFPETLESIGSSAFTEIPVVNVYIPASVTQIGMGAFRNLGALESFVIDENNTVYSSAGNCLINKDTGVLMSGFAISELPDDGSVTSIANYSFTGTAIETLVIPEGVTSIGTGAFGWSALRTVVIPVSMQNVGMAAFDQCALLDTYYLGSSEEWQQIRIMDMNYRLKLNVHYDSTVCDAVGHNFDTNFTFDAQPSENETGIKSRHCLRCDAVTDETVISYCLGDIDGDGKINVKDINNLKKFISGSVGENNLAFCNCDFNGDGKINAKDISAIKRFIALGQ